MADTLTITQSDHGPVKVLHLSGQLNAGTQADLMDAARREQAAGARYLLIDLADVDYIGGAGLAALQNIYKMFTPHEEVEAWDQGHHGVPYKSAYMKLAEASPSVYFVLNIAGFLQNIPIYRTLDECLKSFNA
jgi:ABC-type transporter Mla MlaB component